MNDCACGRPLRDNAVFCEGCGMALDESIASVAGSTGLAHDLDLAISKQTRFGERNGSRSSETGVAWNERASEAAGELKNVLSAWARVVAGETGAGLPVDDLARIAAWLRPRVGWLRYHEAGAEAWAQITEAVKAARRACDRPAERLYAGPCDCGTDLYGRLEASYVMCRNEDCGLAWEVHERRAWLLASAADVLATTTELSRALTRYQEPVTPSTIRGLVARGRLAVAGERREGGKVLPLYRLGDMLDILAERAEKVSA